MLCLVRELGLYFGLQNNENGFTRRKSRQHSNETNGAVHIANIYTKTPSKTKVLKCLITSKANE